MQQLTHLNIPRALIKKQTKNNTTESALVKDLGDRQMCCLPNCNFLIISTWGLLFCLVAFFSPPECPLETLKPSSAPALKEREESLPFFIQQRILLQGCRAIKSLCWNP